ncbi:MAG: DUF423 domain-containing protein [Sulfuricaulis sp.]|uniref:DUF423 domain-containing protein n=1 Tax=Sulfuricaulis sp. TaxID=2003553 RepID=UPI0025E30DFF|nr:DUF423 domain-containing protein [Sulfuricaulis sp.]MCR4347095.1 DUF423 domain-containing protein [Sulfuricaulis sp.]
MGGINAALVVMLGAFGAHGLKTRMTAEMLAVYQTGVHYHLFHALGLLVIGIVATQIVDSAYLKWAGWLMLVGIILFSGSLYLLSVGCMRWLGMVTPFGGLSFIAAWILFVLAIFKAP